MYSNEQLAAMIAALAKRVEKLEGTTSSKSLASYLYELLQQSQRID